MIQYDNCITHFGALLLNDLYGRYALNTKMTSKEILDLIRIVKDTRGNEATTTNLDTIEYLKGLNNVNSNAFNERSLGIFIAGGSVRDYFVGNTKPTDLDIFFTKDTFEWVFNYLIKDEYKVVFESEKDVKLRKGRLTIDLIKGLYESPQQCIETFDFTVSMFAVDLFNVYTGETSFIDLAKRQLMLNNVPFPASTLARALRYHKKGYFICKGELLKLTQAVINIPEDQKALVMAGDTTNSTQLTIDFGSFGAFRGID